MTKHIAVLDDDDRVLRVHAVSDDTVTPLGEYLGRCTEIADWTGWPAEPHPRAELRLVAGALVWHDPRTQDERAADARAERDRLLAATDWVVMRALETGAPVPAPWLSYRAALRDLTDQADFPDSITWPASPSA